MAKGSNAVSVDGNWQARDDVRTLAEAHKIESDPKRFKAAKSEAKRQIKAMSGMLDEEKAEGE